MIDIRSLVVVLHQILGAGHQCYKYKSINSSGNFDLYLWILPDASLLMYDFRADVNWSEFSRAKHTFLMCCGISSRMPGWQSGACVPDCELCTHTASRTMTKHKNTTTCTLAMLQAGIRKKQSKEIIKKWELQICSWAWGLNNAFASAAIYCNSLSTKYSVPGCLSFTIAAVARPMAYYTRARSYARGSHCNLHAIFFFFLYNPGRPGGEKDASNVRSIR